MRRNRVDGVRSTHKAKIMGNGILVSIIVGIIAGFLAGKIMKGSGYGVLMDLVLGLLGGLVGGFITSAVGVGGGGLIWSIVIATLGAVLLVWLARMVSGNRARV
jgi:uncharacterized membrane protein YeaQ/YmgE (transglycosylase-associated protein family)